MLKTETEAKMITKKAPTQAVVCVFPRDQHRLTSVVFVQSTTVRRDRNTQKKHYKTVCHNGETLYTSISTDHVTRHIVNSWVSQGLPRLPCRLALGLSNKVGVRLFARNLNATFSDNWLVTFSELFVEVP